MSNINFKRSLTTEELSILSGEMDKQKKSQTVAFLLWFFLGPVGGHRFYMGHVGYALSMVVFVFLLGMMTGGATFVLTIFWVIIDAFFIPSNINRLNDEKELSIMDELALGRKSSI